MASSFGAELRRARIAKGYSLRKFADLIHYDKGHVSHLEHGTKQPSEQLARLCDGVLETDGVLLRLVQEATESPEPAVDDSWFNSPDGPLTIPFDPGAPTPPVDESWRMFGHIRSYGRLASSRLTLPQTLLQLHIVKTAIQSSRGHDRAQWLELGARLAEFAGWMAQESGDDASALAWTARAAGLAEAAGDLEMAAHGQVRQALVNLYRRRSDAVIQLSEAVAHQRDVSPRIQFLATLREAQGWALAGNYDQSSRALERSENLAGLVDPSGDYRVLGPSSTVDRIALVRGWCLHDLGRPDEARAQLEHHVRAGATGRDTLRFSVRLALVRATQDDIEGACDLMNCLLNPTIRVDSATIRTDVRAFADVIGRRHTVPAAVQLRGHLTAALAAKTGL